MLRRYRKNTPQHNYSDFSGWRMEDAGAHAPRYVDPGIGAWQPIAAWIPPGLRGQLAVSGGRGSNQNELPRAPRCFQVL